MVDWKHPDSMIKLGAYLKKENYQFVINLVGTGSERKRLEKLISSNNLQKNVIMHGSVPSEKVREFMEEANIFVMTSDFNEGWGAVLNEAMNSACAVVASHAIGSVPFLIGPNNGLIYESQNLDDLFKKVEHLMNSQECQRKLGINAYKSLRDTWNAKIAANRFLEVSKKLLEGRSVSFPSGPLSKDYPLYYRDKKNGWFG